jgi:hypothetical protein
MRWLIGAGQISSHPFFYTFNSCHPKIQEFACPQLFVSEIVDISKKSLAALS